MILKYKYRNYIKYLYSKSCPRDPQSWGNSNVAQRFRIYFAFWFICKLGMILTLMRCYLFLFFLTFLSVWNRVKVVTSQRSMIRHEFLFLKIKPAVYSD